MKAPEPTESEIEWQLDALDLRPVERWLAGLPGLPAHVSFADSAPDLVTSTVTALPRAAERLVDTYVDTVDWRIGRSGFVLRVRHRGGRGEVTLKDVVQAKAGLRRRLEVTEPLPADGVGALGPHGPVGWRLRALAGKRPLQSVLEVRTRRRPYDLRVSDERVAEVALDETMIVVGNDHQPVRLQRVEVEVTAPWVKRLTPLVDTLRRECGLQPATLSKFEAGLLAAGLRDSPSTRSGVGVIRLEPIGRRGGLRCAAAQLQRRPLARDRDEARRGSGGAARHAGGHPEDAGGTVVVRRRPFRCGRGTCGASSGGWPGSWEPFVTSTSSSSAWRDGSGTSPTRTAPPSPICPPCSSVSVKMPVGPCWCAWTPPDTSGSSPGSSPCSARGPRGARLRLVLPPAPSCPGSSPPGTAPPRRRQNGRNTVGRPTTSTSPASASSGSATPSSSSPRSTTSARPSTSAMS